MLVDLVDLDLTYHKNYIFCFITFWYICIYALYIYIFGTNVFEIIPNLSVHSRTRCEKKEAAEKKSRNLGK